MTLYNTSGQIVLTAVSDSTTSGLQSTDGSYYIVINSGVSTNLGLYHKSGAFNAVVVTDSNLSYYASNGSLNVIANGDGTYSPILPPGSFIPPSISGFYYLRGVKGEYLQGADGAYLLGAA